MMSEKITGLIVNRPRWLGLMALVFMLGGGWIGLSAAPSPTAAAGGIASPREGFLAPDFTLQRLEGDSMTLSELSGKVVVLNFWASWCPPCRAEMPALQRVYQDERERGLEILAVNTTYQDSEIEMIDFRDRNNLSFPILIERTGEVARQYQIRAMPTTFFIDRQGVIRSVILGGPISEVTLQTKIEELLREAP